MPLAGQKRSRTAPPSGVITPQVLRDQRAKGSIARPSRPCPTGHGPGERLHRPPGPVVRRRARPIGKTETQDVGRRQIKELVAAGQRHSERPAQACRTRYTHWRAPRAGRCTREMSVGPLWAETQRAIRTQRKTADDSPRQSGTCQGHVEGQNSPDQVARPKSAGSMVSESLPHWRVAGAIATQRFLKAKAFQPTADRAARKASAWRARGLGSEHHGLLARRSPQHHEATMILQPAGLLVRSQFWTGHEAARCRLAALSAHNNRPKAAPSAGGVEVQLVVAAGRSFLQIVSSLGTPPATTSEPSSKPGVGGRKPLESCRREAVPSGGGQGQQLSTRCPLGQQLQAIQGRRPELFHFARAAGQGGGMKDAAAAARPASQNAVCSRRVCVGKGGSGLMIFLAKAGIAGSAFSRVVAAQPKRACG